MGKIKASLADISTEFENLPPATYELEIVKFEDIENKLHETIAYRPTLKVVSGGDPETAGKTMRDYIAIVKKDGTPNEVGLSQLKRYFEVCFGIDEVSGPKDANGKRSGGWTDDEFDTDRLIGKRFKGQVVIESYTKEGETEPRKNNKFKAMESL